MPRSEARLFTSIWRDDDFLALTPGAQRLYMFLLSQQELTYAGTMPLRPPRWVPKSAGLTLADVERGLKELEGQGDGHPDNDPGPRSACRQPFIITDPDTGEILVRSLLRRDGAWKQPNLLRSAVDAAAEIESARIRSALLAEIRRLPVDDSPSTQVRTLIAEFIRTLGQGNADPDRHPDDMGQPDPDDGPQDHPDGDPDDVGRARACFPLSPIPGLQPLLPPPPAPAQKNGTRLPEEWLPTRELVDWARRECPHVDSRRETERFGDYWHAKPGKDGRKLDWARTWRNWMRTAEDRQGPRDRPGSRGQQATDDQFDRAMNRANQRTGELA